MRRVKAATALVLLALLSCDPALAQHRVGPKYLYPDPAITPGAVTLVADDRPRRTTDAITIY